MNFEPTGPIVSFQSASAQIADVLGLVVQTPAYGVLALLLVGWLAVWKLTLSLIGVVKASVDYSWWAKRQRQQSARELGVPNNRTAVLIYVSNHDLETVLSNVQWMIESTCQALPAFRSSAQTTSSAGQPIDFFVLSDTSEPDQWGAEQSSLMELQAKYESGPCRLFYQRRTDTEAGRLGCLREFSSKRGTQYPYLVPLNAGTVISGTTLVHSIFQIDRDAGLAAVQFSRLPMCRQPWTGDAGPADHSAASTKSTISCGGVDTPATIFEQWGTSYLFSDCYPLSFDGCVVRSSAFLQNSKPPKYPWDDVTASPQQEIHDQSISALMGLAGWKRQLAPAIDQAHHALPTHTEAPIWNLASDHQRGAAVRNTHSAAKAMGMVFCDGIDWSDRWLLLLDAANKLKSLWWLLVACACFSMLWHDGWGQARTDRLLKLTLVIATVSYLPRLLELFAISFCVWRAEQGKAVSPRHRFQYAATAVACDCIGLIGLPVRAGVHLWCLGVYCLHSAATRMGHRGRFACYIRASGVDQPPAQVGWVVAALGLWLATGSVLMPLGLLGIWMLAARLKPFVRARLSSRAQEATQQAQAINEQQSECTGATAQVCRPMSRRMDECQRVAQKFRQSRHPSVLRFDDVADESKANSGLQHQVSAPKTLVKQGRNTTQQQTHTNGLADKRTLSSAPAAKLR